MLISIVHPSRGRPDIAFNFIIDVFKKLSKHHSLQYILSLDIDDAANYLKRIDKNFCNRYPIQIVVSNNRHHVHAVNYAAPITRGDMIIVTGDDWAYPDQWDELLARTVTGRTDPEYVIHVKDGIQPRIITLPILSQAYYQKFGYIYFPEYASMYADTDFTEVAHLLGKVVDAQGLFFKHNHFTVKGGMPEDATYRKQNSSEAWKIGEKVFNERKVKNFGVK